MICVVHNGKLPVIILATANILEVHCRSGRGESLLGQKCMSRRALESFPLTACQGPKYNTASYMGIKIVKQLSFHPMSSLTSSCLILLYNNNKTRIAPCCTARTLVLISRRSSVEPLSLIPPSDNHLTTSVFPTTTLLYLFIRVFVATAGFPLAVDSTIRIFSARPSPILPVPGGFQSGPSCPPPHLP